MRKLTAVAGEGDAGRKLKYFVRGTMGLSHRQFSSLKARNALLVNGAPVHADHVLSPGDEIALPLEDAPRNGVAPEELPVRIAYEDEDLIFIDKSAPLACQCSPKQPGGTLENRLAFRYRDREGGFVFRPLNRLDRGTSGLMAAAMNAPAYLALQRQLHTDSFVREYLAVVEGRLEGAGTIDAPIAKEQAATVRRSVDFAHGKPAVTHYHAVFSGERHSLVRLRLETGRTHQIRVHLAHLGHPVVGDFLYGTEDARLPGRFALHSTYIRLAHPATGEVVEGTSPLPAELTALLEDDAILGGTATVTVDRPLGSRHPGHPDMVYPVNYGYIRGLLAPDGEGQDAYVLGVEGPVEAFTGRIVAIIRRRDDVEDKWVVCPEGLTPRAEEIMRRVHFQEQYFDSSIVTIDRKSTALSTGTNERATTWKFGMPTTKA